MFEGRFGRMFRNLPPFLPADASLRKLAKQMIEPEPEPGPEPESDPERTSESDNEDVLEETPEFLQDAPEHDRLWFEQKPPRDFDFE